MVLKPRLRVVAAGMWPPSSCISFAIAAIWMLGRVPLFQKAYTEHLQKMADDTWLHRQCSQPDFFTNMRQHTSVCETVRETFNRPALLVALQACIPVELKDVWPEKLMVIGWQTALCLALLMAITPGILLPIYKQRQDAAERDRVLRMCSASLQIPYYAPLCDPKTLKAP